MSVDELNAMYKEEIVKSYVEHKMSLVNVAKKFSTNAKYIKIILEMNGVNTRSLKEARGLRKDDESSLLGLNGRKYTINEEKISKWSEELAYICGFISADGYVTDRFVRIVLQREDKELLEKISNYLEFTGSVQSTVSKVSGIECETCRIEIYNVKLVNFLKNIGITNNKSKTVYISELIPNIFVKDFIRGYFDGDGSIGVIYGTKSKTLNFRVRISSGSKTMIEDIVSYMKTEGILNKAKISTSKKGNIFEICYSTSKAIMIHKLFYSHNPSIFLERKKLKFDELIEMKNKEYNSSTR